MGKCITTPIYYVNDAPHIGTAYTTLVADTMARYWRLVEGEENVFFVTGTDENSQKTVDAAAKKGMEIPAYLEQMAGRFRNCWAALEIAPNDFIRTTEDRHKAGVGYILGRIRERSPDMIYKGTYTGLYCPRCEAFLKPSELTEDGRCPHHLIKPDEVEEENYFFRLSAYSDRLRDLISSGNFVEPASRRNEMLAFIDQGLEDISMTRAGAQIGIAYPEDPEHTLYVWVEAVMNYFSALRTADKEDWLGGAWHVMGKDITRFHAIIWPALLMAAEMEVPEKVFAHGFFTVDGQKMSKSLGNGVDPLALADTYGPDAVRVGLLSSFELGSDGDFSYDGFDQMYQQKLAGGIGNALYRIVTLAHKLMDGKRSPRPHTREDMPGWTRFASAMEGWKLKAAADVFLGVVDEANQYLNEREVWRHGDDEPYKAETFEKLVPYLWSIAEMSRVWLPKVAPKIDAMMGAPDEDAFGEPVILFPRVQA